jgi:hypothetical protein
MTSRYSVGGDRIVEGNVAHDAVNVGNPDQLGGQAHTGNPSTVANLDRVRANFDEYGGLAVWLKDRHGTRAVDTLVALDNVGLSRGVLMVGSIPMLHDGAQFVRQRTPTIYKMIDAVAVTAGTGATVWTPASGKKFRLMGWSLSVSAAAALEFHDNAVGTVVLQSPLLATAGLHESRGELGNGFLSGTADNVLKLDVTADAAVSGMVWGTEE